MRTLQWSGGEMIRNKFYFTGLFIYFSFLPSTLRYPMREGSDYRRRSGRELEE